MSFDSPGSFEPDRTRREDARDKAKAIREQQQKQEKRTRLLVQSTVGLFAIAVIGVVAIVIMTSIPKDGPGPKNMRSDGILIGEDFIAVPTLATQKGKAPLPNEREAGSEVIAIEVYVDYFCPICQSFEEANGDQISTWVETGAATLEIHPIAVLDRVSQGTRYSSRAANAAACVANFSPDQYYAFHRSLFANQPEENSSGLSDDQLVELTVRAGVKSASAIKNCIQEQTFKNWVTEAKDRALTGPIPNSNVEAITSPPTIIVNGLKYTGAPNDAAAFAAFVVQAAGTSFNENSTPTPTPTPTEVPAG